MSTDVSVRRLAAEDWQLLRTLRLAALVDSPLAFSSSYEREAAFDEATWRSRTLTSRYLVAFSDRRPVGMACLVRAVEPDADAAGTPSFVATDLELVSMWVDPAFRRAGVGSALVGAAAASAREAGAPGVVLWVAEGNDGAAGFYGALGFEATSARQPLPGSVNRCESQMRLALPD